MAESTTIATLKRKRDEIARSIIAYEKRPGGIRKPLNRRGVDKPERHLSQASGPCGRLFPPQRPTCGRPERGSGSLQTGKGGNAVAWLFSYLKTAYHI